MPQRYNRTDRISQLLHREIAVMLSRGLRDTRISQRISVTEVTVTRDLAHAKVFVLVPGEPDVVTEQMKLLNGAAKEVRMILSSRVKMRTVPQIKFIYDTTVDHGERITSLLSLVEPEEPEISQDMPDEDHSE